MDEPVPVDNSGPLALAFALQVLGIAADAGAIRHAYGSNAAFSVTDILRAAKAFPIKAAAVNSSIKRLRSTPMPALAVMKNGGYVVLGQVGDKELLLQDPNEPKPQVVTLEEFGQLWTGRLVLLTRRAPLLDPARRFGLGWFLGAVLKYRHVFGEVLLVSLFLQLFALATPLIFQVVIDKVLVHQGLSTLDVLMIGLGLLGIFEVLLGWLRTYAFTHTTSRVDVELGARLFRHLFSLPMAYFQSRRVGDTVARVRELENVRQFLTGSALTLVIDLVFTSVFIAVMTLYSMELTLIVVAALPCYAILSLCVTPVLRRRIEERFRQGAEVQSMLVESVSGIETVKSMAIEPVLQRRWEENLAAYVRASFRTLMLGSFGTQTATLISKVVVVLTLLVGARAVINGDLTVGELVAFNMLAAQVASPVLRLAQLWQDFQQVRVSIDRLGDILNAGPEVTGSGRSTLPRLNGGIRFEHVSFRYRPNAPPVLTDIELDIEPGQVIGIVGRSGSGKSTLAKLIQRLYVPEGGRVMIDGIDLALADGAALRRQIGCVLQDNTLFNMSIRDNIAIVEPGMPLDRIVKSAQLAGAHDFILEQAEGYDTMIGERGASLSGGQRQRIAIARALVSDPRVLIFDEATSALDYESEAVIQGNLRRIGLGRTLILIAHRLSTVRSADRIITLENGRIVEDGMHDDLMRRGGPYSNLHQLQTAMTR
jgi:subfamily B ATP-binding cassette protein HlyB/CyaB